jgi:DNA-binding transcriptional LysR family regulator
LGAVLTQALDSVTEGVEDIRRSRTKQSLTVGATLAMSYFYLLPRLSRFRELHPEMKIRLLSQDEPFDLRSSGLDLVIRYGVPPFPDGRTLISRGDCCFPVCAPSLAERLPRSMGPMDLLSLPLIGHDAADPTWVLWPDWFEAAGVGRRTPSPALLFNHYADGIAAALAGQGVMLGWEMILQDHLARGQLVRIGARMKVDATYNVVVPLRGANPAATAFADWTGAMFEETLAGEDNPSAEQNSTDIPGPPHS